MANQQLPRLGYIEDGDSLEHNLNLMVASQAVWQSSSIQRLLANIEANTFSVASTGSTNSSQFSIPRIDVMSTQLQLQSARKRRQENHFEGKLEGLTEAHKAEVEEWKTKFQELNRKYTQKVEHYEQKLAQHDSEMEKLARDKREELVSQRQKWSEEKAVLEKNAANLEEKLSREEHRQSVLVSILMRERGQLQSKVASLQTSWLSWVTFPARWVYYSGRNLGQLIRKRSHRRAVQVIEQSKLFDMGWYARQYPDVIESGANPAEHYARYGAFEGRDPGPGFSSTKYLEDNQDVAESGVNPLVHYELYGKHQGRSIC
jgi:vacuolar-type H+-ATPase subunit I/STV1